MLILLLSIRFLFYGYPNASNFISIVLYLLAMLGILQVVASAIRMIEFIMGCFHD
jgi:hypothetical protein